MKAILDLSLTAAQLAGAGTVKNDPKEPGYALARYLTIYAALAGITGGTLDVTIQDSIDGITWWDLVHFPQLAAGAAAINYTYSPQLVGAAGIAIVGRNTDPAAPAPVLAAGSARAGHPQDYLRAVAVVGVGASAGAAQTITVVGR